MSSILGKDITYITVTKNYTNNYVICENGNTIIDVDTEFLSWCDNKVLEEFIIRRTEIFNRKDIFTKYGYILPDINNIACYKVEMVVESTSLKYFIKTGEIDKMRVIRFDIKNMPNVIDISDINKFILQKYKITTDDVENIYCIYNTKTYPYKTMMVKKEIADEINKLKKFKRFECGIVAHPYSREEVIPLFINEDYKNNEEYISLSKYIEDFKKTNKKYRFYTWVYSWCVSCSKFLKLLNPKNLFRK